MDEKWLILYFFIAKVQTAIKGRRRDTEMSIKSHKRQKNRKDHWNKSHTNKMQLTLRPLWVQNQWFWLWAFIGIDICVDIRSSKIWNVQNDTQSLIHSLKKSLLLSSTSHILILFLFFYETNKKFNLKCKCVLFLWHDNQLCLLYGFLNLMRNELIKYLY